MRKVLKGKFKDSFPFMEENCFINKQCELPHYFFGESCFCNNFKSVPIRRETRIDQRSEEKRV